MTIPRAIIDDLYPLYVSGDVSAESRALIEEYMAANPGVAMAPALDVKLPPIEPPPDLEARALKRTTRLIEDASLTGAMALSLTYLPAAIGIMQEGQMRLLYQGLPWLAAIVYVVGAVLWVRFYRICRRIQAAGLRPRRTWTARLVWYFCGTLIGLMVNTQIQYWGGRRDLFFAVVLGGLAVWAGESLGQVAKSEDLTRLTTLFGPGSEREDD